MPAGREAAPHWLRIGSMSTDALWLIISAQAARYCTSRRDDQEREAGRTMRSMRWGRGAAPELCTRSLVDCIRGQSDRAGLCRR
jgi:hypothetical protein